MGRNMRQDIIDQYDEYSHEHLNRRKFMRRLAALGGGLAAQDVGGQFRRGRDRTGG